MTTAPERPSLTLVPTPIGNLGDITLRALDVLRSADVILAEDTRTSSKLLNHYAIDRKLQSFHIFNEHRALRGLIDRMRAGECMALISDAGTPGIADPGFLLVRECLRAELKVECLPGPSAFLPALVKSGFPTDRFVFEGFLPHKKGRQTLLKELSKETRTLVFYESPHRLVKTLSQLAEFFGTERRVSVSREISKLHEETRTATAPELASHFSSAEPRGEIVIVVEGNPNPHEA